MAVLRRLALALLIVAALSAVLLWTDRPASRGGGGQRKIVAVVIHSSIQAMLDGRDGAIEQLAARGWREGENLEIRRSNAEGDLAVLGQIAAQIASGDADLLMTFSTPAVQSVFRANRERKPHVFGLVADPLSAGLDIDANDLAKHPAWITGIGTRPPIERLFAMVKQASPGLKRLGTIWNPAEKNAEVMFKAGQKVAADAGFELLDANASSSADVRTAADSLVARGVEAIWVLPDLTVLNAISSVVAAGSRHGVPVVSSIPGGEPQGVALSLGADYVALGRETGEIAARVLSGTSPGEIPVSFRAPEVLGLSLETFPQNWTLDPAWERDAQELVGRDGKLVRTMPNAPPSVPVRPAGKIPTVRIATWADTPVTEDSIRGVREGLREAGLEEEKTVKVDLKSAQLDVGTLNSIMADSADRPPDVLVVITTPALQAAIARLDSTPIVFTAIASPIQAGAGTSRTDHLPNVTGISSELDAPRMAEIVRKVLPQAKSVATIVNPSEVNSTYFRDLLAEAMGKVGIEVRSFAADRPADVSVAADTMASSGIDAIVQISDSLSGSAFPAIAAAAKRANVPLFGFNSDQAERGCVLVVARDFVDMGREAGTLAKRILDGADPATIPFQEPIGSRLIVNEEVAKALGITIPAEVLSEADRRIPTP
jgi:ABC-type uncharacterized transport system substrate-binding protein